MRARKSILIHFLTASFLFLLACDGDDGGERLKGQLGITIEVSGPIDSSHKFLITFSGLVGDLEHKDGVEIGPNDSKQIEMPRVGEQLSIYLSNIPENCPDVSSSSSSSNQIGFNGNPSDSKHPEAQFESIYLIPLDGSVGELTFAVGCE